MAVFLKKEEVMKETETLLCGVFGQITQEKVISNKRSSGTNWKNYNTTCKHFVCIIKVCNNYI